MGEIKLHLLRENPSGLPCLCACWKMWQGCSIWVMNVAVPSSLGALPLQKELFGNDVVNSVFV